MEKIDFSEGVWAWDYSYSSLPCESLACETNQHTFIIVIQFSLASSVQFINCSLSHPPDTNP